MDRSPEASGLAVVHLRHHLGVPGLVGIGGKLDCDWLRAARRRVSVQVFDGIFSFGSFIKPNKSDSPRHTCTAHKPKKNTCLLHVGAQACMWPLVDM